MAFLVFSVSMVCSACFRMMQEIGGVDSIFHMKGSIVTHTSGVDYGNLDKFKRKAGVAAKASLAQAWMFKKLGWEVLEWSWGESVLLFRNPKANLTFGFLVEGLGTKNKFAEHAAIIQLCGCTNYDVCGWDDVAANLNDAIALGASPLVFGPHPALAEGNHLDGPKGDDLIRGIVDACAYAGVLYGPGETPGLEDVIIPGTMCLSGATFAQVAYEPINPQELRPGLSLMMAAARGMHCNGVTAIRKAAAQRPSWYKTPLPDGTPVGKALMERTQIYVPLVHRCQEAGIKIYGAQHISGHGLAKICRPEVELTYLLTDFPKPPPLFDAIQALLQKSHRDMFSAYNMGRGFLIAVEDGDVKRSSQIGENLGIDLVYVGRTVEGPRQVRIEQFDITFTKDDVDVR